jgi:CheY-like chemotaxis protein
VKILIVDDSLLDRKLVINIIKKAGITNEILQASNGEEGLQILSQNYQDICLVILDWQMPKMNGIDFMKSVVSVPDVGSIPIIMISASGSEENKKFAKEVNPQLAGFLEKPYNAQTLIMTITPFLK